MNFSDELNKYIDLLNCSSKELCEMSGLSPALVSRYINNKRIPKANSKYLDLIIDALYKLAVKKNVNLSRESISQTLRNTLDSDEQNYDVFVHNLNTLQDELNISTVELARAVGYDSSFLSRIKSKERKPADFEHFINKLGEYIISTCKSKDKNKILSSLLKCSIEDLDNYEKFTNIFTRWINIVHSNDKQNIIDFLTKLDNFSLNDYISTDLDKIKVPTSPVILKNSRTYYGIEGRKKAEGEFLKTTLLSKSKEPIFFYSNLPISQAAEDEEFKQKWVLAMTMLLKKGLHLNMVHNIDRPLNEMLLGLENWIPIYMTGSISPYYFKNAPSTMFTGSHCTSGSVALNSECINYNEKNSRFYLTTKREELEFEKQKSKYMLSKAKPLMDIFKENNKKEFEEFMGREENKNIQKIKKNIFKNIDFYVNEGKWIMINKELPPEIHFVIYNEKLMNAIRTFLFAE